MRTQAIADGWSSDTWTSRAAARAASTSSWDRDSVLTPNSSTIAGNAGAELAAAQLLDSVGSSSAGLGLPI